MAFTNANPTGIHNLKQAPGKVCSGPQVGPVGLEAVNTGHREPWGGHVSGAPFPMSAGGRAETRYRPGRQRDPRLSEP